MRDKPKKKFEYHRPDPAAMKRQATQSSGVYDQIFMPGAQVFAPKKGQSYCVRIMPATWENCEHFGYEMMIHSGVGADNQRYLCLKYHKTEECPCCEEEVELKRIREDDASYKIKAKRNYAYWVIDRDKEAEGPMLWKVGWKVDRNIVGICIDKRTNATVFIDDPDNGFDIDFDCVPQKEWSEITNIRIARQSTPLSDNEKRQDKWLNYIQENPVDSMLNFFDADHISKVLSGKKVKEDDEDEDETPKTRADRKRKPDDEDEDKPRRKSLRDEDEDEDEEPVPRRKRPVDDEDDEPPVRKRKPTVDDELDEEPEDDEDEPKPKKKPRPVDDDEEDPPPRKKRPVEEDEDEEPAPRRKRTREIDEDDD